MKKKNIIPASRALAVAASPLRALAVAALLALAACTADDAPSPAPAREAIAFGVPSVATPSQPSPSSSSPLTRTAPGTITTDGTGAAAEQSLRDLGFGVFACHTGLHPYVSTSTTTNFMWNQAVRFDASTSLWDYSPLVYWPDDVDGLAPYVTFFAYAPYAVPSVATSPAVPSVATSPAVPSVATSSQPSSSPSPSSCIVDFSLPVEAGDPWLVYQLGGSEDAWQDAQVDLLYAFERDRQRSATAATRVDFQFRHALASAGDHITVTCSDALQQRLQAASAAAGGAPVTLSLTRLAVEYTLLRKGRLSLSSTTSPKWTAVASEEPTVRRRLTVAPDRVLARATATACTLTPYDLRDQGIFYIPLSDSGNPQEAVITVDYTVTRGTDPADPAASVTTSGTLRTRVDLSAIATAAANRDFRVTLGESVQM